MRRTLMKIELAMSRFSVVLSGYATALGNGVRWWGIGMKSTPWVISSSLWHKCIYGRNRRDMCTNRVYKQSH